MLLLREINSIFSRTHSFISETKYNDFFLNLVKAEFLIDLSRFNEQYEAFSLKVQQVDTGNPPSKRQQ